MNIVRSGHTLNSRSPIPRVVELKDRSDGERIINCLLTPTRCLEFVDIRGRDASGVLRQFADVPKQLLVRQIQTRILQIEQDFIDKLLLQKLGRSGGVGVTAKETLISS